MKVQFSFWKKGYEQEAITQALLTYKNKRIIVDKIICEIPCKTTTRKTNPVFVVEANATQVELRQIPKRKKTSIHAYIR
jgi:hypothetical protein